jgi:hypothetical protein
MKVILKASVILIGVCMLAGTIMIFIKNIKILFTRESADYLSSISEVNHVFSVLFFIVYICVGVLIIRKSNYKKILILSLALILWLISGRVVAIKAFSDGRIITGWYYVETDKFNLCESDFDCETITSQETTIIKLPMWRVRINSKHINKVVFIGPFTWNSCIKTLANQIGK